MSTEFHAEDKKLSEILIGRERYKIPRYQRPYSWTTDQCFDLWNDLEGNGPGFLGSFVFNYENFAKDQYVEVIDGQQRLITLTMLMAVLRDLYKDFNEKSKAGLTQDTIAFKDYITGAETYRLTCGDSLNKFFCDNIQKENSNILSITPREKEKKNIKDNYIYLKERAIERLNLFPSNSEKIKYLDELKGKIFDYKIILINAGNGDDAYSIFETVNARGADLTAADLLKNYIFSKLPANEDSIDFAKETWSTIESNIEEAEGRLTISKFIRYFWISKYSFVQEKKLFKAIKKEINDYNNFLLDILKASEYYYKIASEKVSVNDWSEEFNDPSRARKLVESLVGMRTIGITQCYPLLLCLLLNRDKINFDFSYIFRDIENYHFAYSAICKLSGNVVEKVYYRTSKCLQEVFEITDEKRRNKKIQSILAGFKDELLKEHYPKKNIFVEKFMDVEYRNYPLVIYILSRIQDALETGETQIFTRTNIEHILPQDPAQWGLTKKEIKDYVNKLGNLTLIAEKINRRMENKPLKQKAELFKNSKLNLNKELVEQFQELGYNWGEKEINERQKKLAEYAYDVVWKFG